MRYVVILIALLGAGCSSSPAPAAPTPPPVAACQTNNTATVYFQNRTTANHTFDVVWDGSRLTTVSPAADSQTFTVAAGVPHVLRFQFTNTTLLACTQSSPTLATCSANYYSCTG